jgi:hypothetical protein
MSFSGASAHGLLCVGVVEVMKNGDRVRKRPMRMGMAKRMGRSRSLRLSSFIVDLVGSTPELAGNRVFDLSLETESR